MKLGKLFQFLDKDTTVLVVSGEENTTISIEDVSYNVSTNQVTLLIKTFK